MDRGSKGARPPDADLPMSDRRSLIQRQAHTEPARIAVPARMEPDVSLGLERNRRRPGRRSVEGCGLLGTNSGLGPEGIRPAPCCNGSRNDQRARGRAGRLQRLADRPTDPCGCARVVLGRPDASYSARPDREGHGAPFLVTKGGLRLMGGRFRSRRARSRRRFPSFILWADRIAGPHPVGSSRSRPGRSRAEPSRTRQLPRLKSAAG